MTISTVKPQVGIIMGSTSDLDVMKAAAEMLDALDIPHQMKVASAHRTPDLVHEFATTAAERGLEVIIAGAGGAAHLPVIGVPVQSKALKGLDTLLSIVQMPSGVPVATVGIDGAKNAGLLAARILAIKYPELEERLKDYAKAMADRVRSAKLD